MKQINKLAVWFLGTVVLASCVTQKKKEDVSTLGKLYHNTTAKYNGYFNANELLEESILRLEEQHKDNFNQILPVYDYVDVDNPQAVAGDLDEAIKKVSVVVNLHRVSQWTDDCYLLVGKAQYLKQDYEAAEETLRYTVDQFSPEKMAKKEAAAKKSKKKGSSAREKDDEDRKDITEMSEKEKRQLAREQEKERKKYNKEIKKKRKEAKKRRKQSSKNARKKKSQKKEEKPAQEGTLVEGESTKKEKEKESAPAEAARPEITPDDEGPVVGPISIFKDEGGEIPEGDPDSYFLKHRPAYQDAVLWLARTFIERKKFEDAQRMINQLERNPKTYEDIRRELAVVKANFHLKKGDFEQALPSLEEAIASATKRTEKARFAFIIAQLYQRAGRRGDAFAAFQRALKFGPPYDMEFSGQLYIVQNGWKNGNFSTPEAQDRLDKMLRDSKNLEYRDQIYFTLAQIDLESGDRGEGIQNLKSSLAFSVGNQVQKAESYLTLAELYREEEDFINARYYYDSTLTVLPKTDDRYPGVERWRNSLTDIAENLQIIAYQDSMLRIAALSDAEKRALAYSIKKQRDEERFQQLAAPSQPPGNTANINARPQGLSPNQVGAPGESAFFAYSDRDLRRGQRDFEQRWGPRPLEDNWRLSNKRPSGDLTPDALPTDVPVAALPDDEINQILRDVPKNDVEKTAAELKIQEAMFKLGILYRERLDDNRKAVAVLEELNQRFPRSSFQLESWYFLYLAYNDLNEPARAAEYARIITDRFPSSKYAQVINNPNYAVEMAREENRLSNYYDETFAVFTSGNFQEAYRRSQEASRLFGTQNPMQPKFALLSAMSAGNVQGREAYVAALNDIIARYPNTEEQKRAREILRLLGETSASLPGYEQEAAATSQFKASDDQLHYIIIIFNEDIALNDSKVAVSNYNLEYHKLDRLRISNVYLGTDAETRIPMLVIRRFNNKKEAMVYYDGVQKNQQDFIDPSIDYEIFAVSQDNYREILRSKSISGYREYFDQNYR